MMHDFPSLQMDTLKSIFADDCNLCRSGKNLESILSVFWNEIKKVFTCCEDWGFNININETKFMIFTKKNIKIPKVIIIGNKTIEVVSSYKYLRIFFDSKLKWDEHIKYLCNRLKLRINLLKCLTTFKWANSSKNLIIFYQSVIRSVLDYGCFVYSQAPAKLLKKLDSIKYKCLKICLRAYPGTPLVTLQVEAGQLPLSLWRLNLELIYTAKSEITNKSCTKPFLNKRKDFNLGIITTSIHQLRWQTLLKIVNHKLIVNPQKGLVSLNTQNNCEFNLWTEEKLHGSWL